MAGPSCTRFSRVTPGPFACPPLVRLFDSFVLPDAIPRRRLSNSKIQTEFPPKLSLVTIRPESAGLAQTTSYQHTNLPRTFIPQASTTNLSPPQGTSHRPTKPKQRTNSIHTESYTQLHANKYSPTGTEPPNMAIRETWHRMVRKSFSSSSSTARSDDGDDTTAPAATTAGTSPTPSVPLSKTSSRLTGNLSKITSWRSNTSHNSRHNRHGHNSNGSNGSNNGAKEHDPPSRKASPKRDSPPKSILKKSGGNGGGGFGSGFPRRLHPSERPLTEQNLRHQEMLGTFTMKFGRSRRFSRGARSSFSGISPRCSVDSSAGAPGWDDGEDASGGPGYHHGRMSSAAVAPDEARIAEESS